METTESHLPYGIAPAHASRSIFFSYAVQKTWMCLLHIDAKYTLPLRDIAATLGICVAVYDDNLPLTVSFALVVLEVHMPNLLFCQLLTGMAFVAISRNLTMLTQIAGFIVGSCNPLYPPEGNHESQNDQIRAGSAGSFVCQIVRQVSSTALPHRRFLNAGNTCYGNVALQLLGTSNALVPALRHHACQHACVACWLKRDLCSNWFGHQLALCKKQKEDLD